MDGNEATFRKVGGLWIGRSISYKTVNLNEYTHIFSVANYITIENFKAQAFVGRMLALGEDCFNLVENLFNCTHRLSLFYTWLFLLIMGYYPRTKINLIKNLISFDVPRTKIEQKNHHNFQSTHLIPTNV